MMLHIRKSQLEKSPESIKALREAIKTIKTLQKKYGEKVKDEKLQTIIADEDPTTYSMLSVLIKTNTYNQQSIQALYELIKTYKEQQNDTVEVKVTGGVNTTSLEQKYEKVEKQETTQIGISIKKGESIYKRDLDNDINKLLA